MVDNNKKAVGPLTARKDQHETTRQLRPRHSPTRQPHAARRQRSQRLAARSDYSDQAQRLIQEAVPHKEKRYAWLLDRMASLCHTDLAEEYHKRKLAIEAQRRYAAKERQLKQWQQRLASTDDPQYATYIRKQILKCEEYLEERKPL